MDGSNGARVHVGLDNDNRKKQTTGRGERGKGGVWVKDMKRRYMCYMCLERRRKKLISSVFAFVFLSFCLSVCLPVSVSVFVPVPLSVCILHIAMGPCESALHSS